MSNSEQLTKMGANRREVLDNKNPFYSQTK